VSDCSLELLSLRMGGEGTVQRRSFSGDNEMLLTFVWECVCEFLGSAVSKRDEEEMNEREGWRRTRELH